MTLLEWLLWLFSGKKPPPLPPPVPPPVNGGDVAKEMLDLHNQERGLDHPLQLEHRLMQAAQAHAIWMEQHNQLSHEGFLDRVRAAGYIGFSAENIAMNSGSVASTFAMWMDSPGHRTNIVNPIYRYVGFAKVGNYWCAIYGG